MAPYTIGARTTAGGTPGYARTYFIPSMGEEAFVEGALSLVRFHSWAQPSNLSCPAGGFYLTENVFMGLRPGPFFEMFLFALRAGFYLTENVFMGLRPGLFFEMFLFALRAAFI